MSLWINREAIRSCLRSRFPTFPDEVLSAIEEDLVEQAIHLGEAHDVILTCPVIAPEDLDRSGDLLLPGPVPFTPLRRKPLREWNGIPRGRIGLYLWARTFLSEGSARVFARGGRLSRWDAEKVSSRTPRPVLSSAVHVSPSRRYRLVTPESLSEMLDELRSSSLLSFDTETMPRPGWDDCPVRPGLRRRWDLVCGISISTRPGSAWYLPTRDGDPKPGLEELLRALADPNLPKIGHNARFDILAIRTTFGVTVSGISDDTSLLAWLIGKRTTSLKDLVREDLGEAVLDIDEVMPKTGMGDVDPEALLPYVGADADMPLRLRALYRTLIPRELHRPYRIDLDLIPVLAEMEWRGMAVDRSRLNAALDILDREIECLLDQIESLTSRRIRPTNPNEIRELLFDAGLLPDRSSSVDKDTLQGLLVDYPGHPLISAIAQVRQRVTLRSSFVQKLPKLINPNTGRIHPSFNTVNTETGRLSCSDPNLQNIPRRSSLGKAIRLAFIGSPSLIVADKSQIEPRILAHVTGDPGLRDIFARDLDLYRMVGSRIFGKDPDQITDHERSLMKVVTLATQYGATGWTIARRASDPMADPPFVMTPQEGDAFLSAYLSAYPGIKAWMDRVIAEARRTGFSVTEIGNRRYLPGITSPDPVERREAERQAINHPIQGLAAYLMKLVLIALHRENVPVTNSVHDEVVVESNDPSLIPLIRELIESCYPLSVPIRAEIGMGPSWAEAKP